MSTLLWLLYFAVGYALYRMRWPEGVLPRTRDDERERLQRVGRRRVLPLPSRPDDAEVGP